jgi:uncharacterized protein (TIGR03000 family)
MTTDPPPVPANGARERHALARDGLGEFGTEGRPVRRGPEANLGLHRQGRQAFRRRDAVKRFAPFDSGAGNCTLCSILSIEEVLSMWRSLALAAGLLACVVSAGTFAQEVRKTVTVEVYLPQGARLFVEDQEMRSKGAMRRFVSPPLPPGKYVYTVKAIFPERTGPRTVTRRVDVRPGDFESIDLRRPGTISSSTRSVAIVISGMSVRMFMNRICLGSRGRNGRKSDAPAMLNMFPKLALVC